MVHEKRAANNFRRSSSKKARLSDVDRDESSRSTILSVDSGSESSDIDVTDPEDEDNLDDEDAEDNALVRDLRASKRKRAENQAAENGIIEEVICRNFMCHGSLTVKLGPLINFIIGHNGSGKSAVLTALTLCLGGKASSTNRGQALKDFIKEGQDQATLAVKLKNQGSSAYKPEVFGPSLTIERSFTRNGTSSWKVKTSSGKIELTKKADVDELVEFYALQLDNPMNVLTQDMARQFLSDSTPADKYKFFQKGTNLEQLDRDYKVMEDDLQNSTIFAEDMSEQVEILKRKWEDAHKASERVSGLQQIRLAIRDTVWQMAWIQVEEAEKELDNIGQQINAAEEKIQQKQSKFEEITERFDSAFGRLEAAKATEEKIKEELSPLEEEKEELSARFREGRGELENAIRDRREVHGNLESQKSGIQRLEERIAEEQRKIDNGEEGSRRIYSKIQEKKATLNAEQEELGQLQLQQETHKFDLENAKKVESQTREAMKDRRSVVDSHKSKILQLSKDQGRIKMPGNVQSVIEAIERETRFRSKPVGPVWKYVHLQDMKWSSILERYFGATLEAFCVSCRQDADLLRELLRQYKCTNRVFISPTDPLNTSRIEPRSDIMTILRVLTIGNDLVRNTLIINHNVEQTMLLWDRNEANKANSGKIAGVVSILSSTGDSQHQRGSGLRHTAKIVDGKLHQSTSPIKAWDRESRMRADLQEQLRYAEAELQKLIDELAQSERTFRDAQNLHENCAKAHHSAIRSVKEKRNKVSHLDEEITQLQEELENVTPQGGVLEALEIDCTKEKEELERLEQTYMTLVNTIDKINSSQESLKRGQRSFDQDIKLIKVKLLKAQDHVAKIDREQQTALHAKSEAGRLVQHAKADKEGLEKQLEVQRNTIQDFADKAGTVSERVSIPEGTTQDGLKTKYERLREDMEKAQQEMGGSEEQLKAKELDAKNAYDDSCVTVEGYDRLIEALKGSISMRKDRWHKFQQHIAIKAINSFSYLLSERQFRGSLNISHEDKTLDIHVEPDLTRKSNKGRQTKTLSGGEKSFSTICLLLALWEAMGSPIRCLDEFDVFMDNVNREISMSMMIEAAREQIGRQFILITPQSMGKVPRGPDIKVHRMLDPERGQTTLPFTTAAH